MVHCPPNDMDTMLCKGPAHAEGAFAEGSGGPMVEPSGYDLCSVRGTPAEAGLMWTRHFK